MILEIVEHTLKFDKYIYIGLDIHCHILHVNYIRLKFKLYDTINVDT